MSKKSRKTKKNNGTKIPFAVLDELRSTVEVAHDAMEEIQLITAQETEAYGFSPTRIALVSHDWLDRKPPAPAYQGRIKVDDNGKVKTV